MQITVVGLGPGPADLLTVRAEHALRQAKRLFLRTRAHPVAETLRAWGVAFTALDEYVERAPTLEDAWRAMADRLLEEAAGAPDRVVYGVPGHPLVGEPSVGHLLARAMEQGAVELVPSPSGPEAAWVELRVDPVASGAAYIDARQLARFAPLSDALPPPSGMAWERRRGYLVLHLDSPVLAAQVKAALQRARGRTQPVAVVHAAGTAQARVEWTVLGELDRRRDFGPGTGVYVPPADGELPGAGEGMEALVRIMARLRAPDGCPWDRRQTPGSLRRYIIDEAYEACEAIERGDPDRVQDELGDLLLQVLFQAQIASEQGRFDMAGVEAHLRAKLIRRHPHVFGDARVKDAAEVLERWEAIKRQERGQAEGDQASGAPSSLMDGLTTGLPSLSFAEAVQRRAATVGFEWPEISGAGRKA
ncbi:MAG: MazG family protein, partial [Bacillota bacterium]